jgi:N-acetylmuramoyl-L-alanine amidase
MRVVISSGHGKYVRGASGIIDEVDEARIVVPTVAGLLQRRGVDVVEFNDDVSTTQSDNLDAIVDFHNSHTRDLDVSVHFNAYIPTDGPRGTECLYLTQSELAARVSTAIADASGLLDRGAHKRTDLAFLNGTDEPAILIECCFVDSVADCELYDTNFDDICAAIADAIVGEPAAVAELPVRFKGTVSWFGGPDDDGVASDEGLAFLYEVADAPHLFLPEQPEGTTGLARRLNPDRPYVACRWDYSVTPKDTLAQPYPALIIAKSGESILAWPADWGPHEEKTGRAADVSPYVMNALGIVTDDEVEVIYPAPLPVRA